MDPSSRRQPFQIVGQGQKMCDTSAESSQHGLTPSFTPTPQSEDHGEFYGYNLAITLLFYHIIHINKNPQTVWGNSGIDAWCSHTAKTAVNSRSYKSNLVSLWSVSHFLDYKNRCRKRANQLTPLLLVYHISWQNCKKYLSTELTGQRTKPLRIVAQLVSAQVQSLCIPTAYTRPRRTLQHSLFSSAPVNPQKKHPLFREGSRGVFT